MKRKAGIGLCLFALWNLGCPESAPLVDIESLQGAPANPQDAGVSPDAGTTVVDAGTQVDAGVSVDAGVAEPDAGSPIFDAGVSIPDAGAPDAGTPDAGEPDGGAITIVYPPATGWQYFGASQGGPQHVFGVSSDRGGNIWAAGGDDGLFLLPVGGSTFQRFTAADGLRTYSDSAGVHSHAVISVAGAEPGVVYVGYRGLFGGQDDNDPQYMVRSGDAARVALVPGGVSVTHLDISTPPGEDPHYPQGRDKIRSVYRIAVSSAGDVWLGGNHGVALYEPSKNKVTEHQHAAINGTTTMGGYILLSGDWWGLALDSSDDVWMGGGHRMAKLPFSTSGRNFWAPFQSVTDVWPDLRAVDPAPEERVDDFIQDLALSPDGSVWVGSISNALARVRPGWTEMVRSGLMDARVTSLETDPLDGSIWVGHIYGGLTRIRGNTFEHFSQSVFGPALINGPIPDIQSHTLNGQRRILVAFQAGWIGIYTGS